MHLRDDRLVPIRSVNRDIWDKQVSWNGPKSGFDGAAADMSLPLQLVDQIAIQRVGIDHSRVAEHSAVPPLRPSRRCPKGASDFLNGTALLGSQERGYCGVVRLGPVGLRIQCAGIENEGHHWLRPPEGFPVDGLGTPARAALTATRAHAPAAEVPSEVLSQDRRTSSRILSACDLPTAAAARRNPSASSSSKYTVIFRMPPNMVPIVFLPEPQSPRSQLDV